MGRAQGPKSQVDRQTVAGLWSWEGEGGMRKKMISVYQMIQCVSSILRRTSIAFNPKWCHLPPNFTFCGNSFTSFRMTKDLNLAGPAFDCVGQWMHRYSYATYRWYKAQRLIMCLFHPCLYYQRVGETEHKDANSNIWSATLFKGHKWNSSWRCYWWWISGIFNAMANWAGCCNWYIRKLYPGKILHCKLVMLQSSKLSPLSF